MVAAGKSCGRLRSSRTCPPSDSSELPALDIIRRGTEDDWGVAKRRRLPRCAFFSMNPVERDGHTIIMEK